MNKKRIVIILDEDMQRAIEVVKRSALQATTAGSVRFALSFTAQKYKSFMDEDYTKPKRAYGQSTEDKVAKKLEQKKEEAEVKKALILEKGIGICNQLEGILIDQPSGIPNCSWKTYTKTTPHHVIPGGRTLSVDLLTENLIAEQYKGGTKEQIKEII